MYTSEDKIYMSKGGKKTAKKYGKKYMKTIASIGGKKSGEVRRAKRDARLARLAKLSTSQSRFKSV